MADQEVELSHVEVELRSAQRHHVCQKNLYVLGALKIEHEGTACTVKNNSAQPKQEKASTPPPFWPK